MPSTAPSLAQSPSGPSQGTAIIKVHRQRFRFLGYIGFVHREGGKIVVEDVEEVARHLGDEGAFLVGDIHHDHAGLVELAVGAEIQAAPRKRPARPGGAPPG